MKQLKIEIAGMTCGGCVNAVKTVLGRMEGVRAADVRIGEASVTFDEHRASDADFKAAIERAGFTATTMVSVPPA